MNKWMKWVVAVSAVLAFSAAQADQTYYVQSVKAKVLSAPSFRSSVLSEVAMGQALTVKGHEGSWVKVSVSGKEGYVSSLLVATHPPLKREGFIKAEDTEIKQGVRRRSSAFASAAAARGLTKEDRQRSDADDRVDYGAVKTMESTSVSESEVDKFAAGAKP